MWTYKTLILVLTAHSTAAIGGWFGPSTYEDCILDGLKTAKTDGAVRVIMQTCRTKFPEATVNKTAAGDKALIKKREAAQKKCRLNDSENNNATFSTNFNSKVANILNSLGTADLNFDENTVSFQNNSQSGIHVIGIGFGIKNGKTCSWDASAYKAVLYCDAGAYREAGIPSGSYGTLNCNNNIKKFRGYNYCVIKFRPAVDPNKGLSITLDELGLCNW